MMQSKIKKILVVSGVVLGVSALCGYRLLFPGIPFLLTYMDAEEHPALTVQELKINNSGRIIPARLYAPKSPHGTIVLIHGVHSDGYNEKRLIHFTQSLVQLGFQVVTPDIEDLRQYQIVQRAVDDIQASTDWVLNHSKIIKSDEQVGLWGISFAGGLCLSIAGQKEFSGRIASSFAFGGHGDLDDTIRYLMSGDTPSGHLPPHVYGQAVLVRKYAHQLVPPEQQESLRTTVLHYLRGEYKVAKRLSQQLPQESRQYSSLIFKGDEKQLGALLASNVTTSKTPDALSAVRNAPPANPIFLLHGSVDNVIPPHESEKLSHWAEAKSEDVQLLISPLINHVELEEQSDSNKSKSYLEIIRFWTKLLRATES